jgi:hypothetical protein
MKKLKFLMLLGLPMLFGEAYGQKYQSPQWEMPLCFEDATGARDTLWFGYDPTAGLYGEDIDPQFNEDWQWIDTSLFNVYFLHKGLIPPFTGQQDSVRKRDISSWPLIITTDIRFTHGQLPVTMKWDEELLNSPKLPTWFRDISPRPRARIDLIFENPPFGNVENCPMGADLYPDIILTGYIVLFPTCFCTISDSLVFNPDEWDTEMSQLQGDHIQCYITRHDYDYFSSVQDYQEVGILLYPNPVKDLLTIENAYQNMLTVLISDLYGRRILEKQLFDINNQIDFSGFNRGLYLVQIIDCDKMYNFKINKK